MKLRLATESDVPALRELIALSARGLSQGYYSQIQIESAIRYVFGVDSQLLADRTYFLVESDSQLVGCGGWSKRKTLFGGDQFKAALDPLLDPLVEAARIRAFFIHPQWGRRGIGRTILSACENAARLEGFGKLELGSTLPGVPFYGALGFEPHETIELSFPDGVRLPIVRMSKALIQ
jgi:N-acetylglutamate synthase-like GNAT family acetyltransferase